MSRLNVLSTENISSYHKFKLQDGNLYLNNKRVGIEVFGAGKNMVLSDHLYGVTDDVDLSGRLVVDGSMVLGNNMFVVGDISADGVFLLGGDISLGSNMFLAGDLSADGVFMLGGDISLGSNMFVVGDISADGVFLLGGDISLGSNMFLAGDLSADGVFMLGGDISLGSNMFLAGDLSADGVFMLGGDISLGSNMFLAGDLSAEGVFLLGGDISLGSNMFLAGDLSAEGVFLLGGDISLGSNMFLAGDLSADGVFLLGGDISLGSNMFLAGDLSADGVFMLGGDISLGSNMFLAGDLSADGVFLLAGDISLGSNMFLAGDLSADGVFMLGGDISLGSNMFLAGDLSADGVFLLGGDISLGSNMFLAGDLSADGDLFLNGNIHTGGYLKLGTNVLDFISVGETFIYGNESQNTTNNTSTIRGNLDICGLLVVETLRSLNLEFEGDIDFVSVGIGTIKSLTNTQTLRVEANILVDGTAADFHIEGPFTIHGDSDMEVLNVYDWVPDTNQNLYYDKGNIIIGATTAVDASLNVFGKVYIGGDLEVAGVITAQSVIQTSDARLKTNVQDLTHGLDLIRQIQPKLYNKNDLKEAGVLAQDILEIEGLEHLVHLDEKTQMYSVNYMGLYMYAIQAIKELEAKLLRALNSPQGRCP
jgi:predicted acyltransferase (DUF342 family)